MWCLGSLEMDLMFLYLIFHVIPGWFLREVRKMLILFYGDKSAYLLSWYREGTFHMADLSSVFRETKEGQSILVPVFSQVPLIQNNPYAKATSFGVACSAPLQLHISIWIQKNVEWKKQVAKVSFSTRFLTVSNRKSFWLKPTKDSLGGYYLVHRVTGGAQEPGSRTKCVAEVEPQALPSLSGVWSYCRT